MMKDGMANVGLNINLIYAFKNITDFKSLEVD